MRLTTFEKKVYNNPGILNKQNIINITNSGLINYQLEKESLYDDLIFSHPNVEFIIAYMSFNHRLKSFCSYPVDIIIKVLNAFSGSSELRKNYWNVHYDNKPFFMDRSLIIELSKIITLHPDMVVDMIVSDFYNIASYYDILLRYSSDYYSLVYFWSKLVITLPANLFDTVVNMDLIFYDKLHGTTAINTLLVLILIHDRHLFTKNREEIVRNILLNKDNVKFFKTIYYRKSPVFELIKIIISENNTQFRDIVDYCNQIVQEDTSFLNKQKLLGYIKK